MDLLQHVVIFIIIIILVLLVVHCVYYQYALERSLSCSDKLLEEVKLCRKYINNNSYDIVTEERILEHAKGKYNDEMNYSNNINSGTH